MFNWYESWRFLPCGKKFPVNLKLKEKEMAFGSEKFHEEKKK